MATIPYVVGESGTLGFQINQYDGSPMPLDGLDLRLTVYLPGADLILPGNATSGEVVPPLGGAPIMHPSIASFDVTPENLPLSARVYRCALLINDGSGWRTIGDHLIDVRRP